MNLLRSHANIIVTQAIAHVMPDQAVFQALKGQEFGSGRLILVSVGKAGWTMAKAAFDCLGSKLSGGIVITKYGHARGAIGSLRIREAGHPVPDENSFSATEEALALTAGLTSEDTVLFLLSGGGSALFESPLIPRDELQDMTNQLLASGADIVEMNTVRKRLSAVKGGRFAQHCAPAQVFTVVLSDIIGDPLNMIASGPAYPDASTAVDAQRVVEKYGITLSSNACSYLELEAPKALPNVRTKITGSVRELCSAAADACRALGYEPYILTDCLNCEAREAGAFLAAIAKTHQNTGKSTAFLAGGETVVHLTGKGLGGRNQELALSAARGIAGLKNTAIFSVGSDGTDGPTDAAGGYVDGNTAGILAVHGIDLYSVLQNNDAYHALEKTNGLIMTGGTGTNVNDVSVVLIHC